MSSTAMILERRAPWLSVVILSVLALAQGGAPLRFGDGLELVAVSSHLGIAHPSGYPLFTLLLHVAQQLPLGEPYLTAMWLCRAAAVACAFGIFLSLHAVLRSLGARSLPSLVSALLFAAAFLLGASLRTTMHVVEVYGLNAALVSAIVALLVWTPAPGAGISARRILIVCAIQGLALAHHLTSVALLPLVIYVLWRYARSSSSDADTPTANPRNTWMTVALGTALLVGLPLLLYGSLMARTPEATGYGIAWGAPENPGALLRHVRGIEYGSTQFLRADPFTHFTFSGWWAFFIERVGQFVAGGGSVFVGVAPMSRLVGWGAVIMTLVGGVSWFRRDSRRGYFLGLVAAIALQFLFVISYNIADIADYFLAIQVLCLPLTIIGLARVFEGTAQRVLKSHDPSVVRWFMGVPLILLVLAVTTTTRVSRPSSVGLTETYQTRLLAALPEGSAILSSQSADLFLLWYTRFSQNERADLFVYPANMHDRNWIRRSFPLKDPRREAVGFSERGMERLGPYVEEMRGLVIEPLFQHGRVFATISHVGVLESLAKHYNFRQAAQLMSPEEARQLALDGRPGAPPILWELRRKSR